MRGVCVAGVVKEDANIFGLSPWQEGLGKPAVGQGGVGPPFAHFSLRGLLNMGAARSSGQVDL